MPPAVFSSALRVCEQNSLWLEALALFHSSGGVSEIQSLIRVLCVDVVAATELAEGDASTQTFNAALAACCAGRNYELARTLHRQMADLGLLFDLATAMTVYGLLCLFGREC